MATAFTQRERERIYQSLQDAALQRAATSGMKHVTVDELAHEAGISKGAFYRFFESKEHLFLFVLERIQDEMYGNAERVLTERSDLDVRERIALAIYEVCHTAEQSGAMNFIREEVPLLIRRLPEETLREHYRSDTERIRSLVLKSNVKLNTSIDTACAVIRLLLLSIPAKKEVGEQFSEAIRLIIDGASERLVQ